MRPIIGRSYLLPLSDFELLAGDNQIGARACLGGSLGPRGPRLPTHLDAIDPEIWRVRGLGGFSLVRDQTIEGRQILAGREVVSATRNIARTGGDAEVGTWNLRATTPGARMRPPVGRLHLLRGANRFEGLTRAGSHTVARDCRHTGPAPFSASPGQSSPASTTGATSTSLTPNRPGDARLNEPETKSGPAAFRLESASAVRLPRAGPTDCGLWRSLVSALDWGSRGPGFKSRQPDASEPSGRCPRFLRQSHRQRSPSRSRS